MDHIHAKLAAMTRHHAIDYVEFQVTDMAAAKRFYGEAFGWEFTDYGPGYVGIQGEGKEQGGFTLAEQVTTGGPLIVLYSEDLQKTLAAVQDAGGTITKEVFSFPGGSRFEFSDPSGNQLAVWTTGG